MAAAASSSFSRFFFCVEGLFPPGSRAGRSVAPATALLSFFLSLPRSRDLLTPSGEAPPAPALPAAEGHRGSSLLCPQRGRIHRSKENRALLLLLLLLPQAAPLPTSPSRGPAQEQAATQRASVPRPRRTDGGDRSVHYRSARRRDSRGENEVRAAPSLGGARGVRSAGRLRAAGIPPPGAAL